jgi:SAM-dependent methyltransferase
VAANAYNAVPYTTFARQKTHPDRLATVGTLFGMRPAPVKNCRVLEIGCGDGSNLIPLAYYIPGSRFVGVDIADAPIAAGRHTAEALRLTNISLDVADVCSFGAEAGEFDYIIAHGLYSWVPPEVQDCLLSVCRERLAPQGVAFVSYNVLPGRHVRTMLREMMRYHVRDCREPAERIRQARWFLEFLLNNRLLSPTMGALIENQAKALLEHNEGGLYHDDLAEINTPVYFHEFAAHAGRHGLQYLGECDFYEMFDPKESLSWLKDNVLEREQYLDFLHIRMFRQTLLCRHEVTLDRHIGPSTMEQFLFSAPAKEVEGGQIEGLHSVRISALNDNVKRVTSALGEVYPLPVSFEELVPYAGDRTALAEILFALFTGGFAEIHVHDFPCEETVTERPTASRLVRFQARTGQYVTSAAHHVVQLDEVGRTVVPLLDGTCTVDDITRFLASHLHGSADEIRPHVVSLLQEFAGLALLEG